MQEYFAAIMQLWDALSTLCHALRLRAGVQGPVRRIHFAPPAAEDLVRGAGNPSSRGNARVSVLFANGTFGIWELDSRNELQQVIFE